MRVSDAALARKIGMSQPAMSRRTNEEVPFDVDDLGRIADVLGISVVDLIQMPTMSGTVNRSGVEAEPQNEDYQDDVSGDVIHVDFRARSASAS